VDANIRCMRGEKRGSASNKKRISMYSSRHVFISTRRDAHNGFKKAPCARLHSLCAVFLFRVIKSCFPRKIDREKERGGYPHPPGRTALGGRVTSRVTPASSHEHITGFARDQRGPWQWLASTTRTTTTMMTTTTTLAMEPTGRRETAGAGVATQTPSARAVRSMHPEVARSRSRPAATTLTLYATARWRTRFIHSSRSKVADAAARAASG